MLIGPTPEMLDVVYDVAQKEVYSIGAYGEVDELAVLFPSETLLSWYLEHMEHAAGWEHFNSAEDRVSTEPLGTRYGVHYRFLQHPDRAYRVEAMSLMGGFSPLHAAMLGHGIPAGIHIVHASWKVDDEEQYGAEVLHLRSKGYECAQRCFSDYGRFSYWKRTDQPADSSLVWLKPRVNLRDSVSV